MVEPNTFDFLLTNILFLCLFSEIIIRAEVQSKFFPRVSGNVQIETKWTFRNINF